MTEIWFMKNSQKFILLILICILPLKASDPVNYFGVKASNISGYGLYYSRDISEQFRVQAMGLVYYYEMAKQEDKESIFNYDIGLEFQTVIYKGENSRTYLLAGGYYYHDDDLKDYGTEIKTVNNSFNLGIGIGFEFRKKRLVYNFDFGYKYFDDDLDTYKNGEFEYNELKRVTKIGAGIGIGFNF
jgi:hypothetical protein